MHLILHGLLRAWIHRIRLPGYSLVAFLGKDVVAGMGGK